MLGRPGKAAGGRQGRPHVVVEVVVPGRVLGKRRPQRQRPLRLAQPQRDSRPQEGRLLGQAFIGDLARLLQCASGALQVAPLPGHLGQIEPGPAAVHPFTGLGKQGREHLLGFPVHAVGKRDTAAQQLGILRVRAQFVPGLSHHQLGERIEIIALVEVIESDSVTQALHRLRRLDAGAQQRSRQRRRK